MNRSQLITQVQDLDTELNQLFQSLRPYSHEALNQSPKPGAWSTTQVLHHIMLSERYSQKYCEKKLSFEPQLGKAGWQDSLRSKLVAWYLQAPLKVKAPKNISGPALPNDSKLADIEEEWLKQREGLHNFFQTVPELYLDKTVYKHPFGGRLSFQGMLTFFRAHFQRHERQIWRTVPKA